MTDEEIIALAEKVKKQKYCPEYMVCLCGINECHISCPNSYVDDIMGVVCGDTIYETGFRDGFKAAMEYINQIPHFLLKHDNNTEIIEKFRDSPELYQTYLSEMEKNIQCIINGILSREK